MWMASGPMWKTLKEGDGIDASIGYLSARTAGTGAW